VNIQRTDIVIKPCFADVLKQSKLEYYILVNVARDVAHVPQSTIDDMLHGKPVMPFDAAKVLKILYEHTGVAHTLESVAIPVLVYNQQARPTVLELCLEFRFNAGTLAILADVSEHTVHALFGYQPVFQSDASKVLVVLSQLLDCQCTLENMDVPVIHEGVTHEQRTQENFC